MTVGRFGVCVSLMMFAAAMPGCREKDPPPSHNVDLGETGRPLPPTSGAVHDVTLKDGSADLAPFREPTIPSDEPALRPSRGNVAGSGDVAVGGEVANAGEIEKEIRDAIVEFNDLLTDGTTEDLLDFFTEEQSKIAGSLISTLESLDTKLGELAEVAGDRAPAIEAIRTQLVAARLLAIDPVTVKVDVANKVTVTLSKSPLPPFLPGLSDEAKAALTVTFSMGEDGFWYIDSPIVSALGSIEPTLKQVITEIDGLVSGGDATSSLSAAALLGPMLQALADGSHGDDGDAGG